MAGLGEGSGRAWQREGTEQGPAVQPRALSSGRRSAPKLPQPGAWPGFHCEQGSDGSSPHPSMLALLGAWCPGYPLS